MYSYETLVLLRAELPEAQVRETIERAKRLIESQQGTMTETQDWGLRELAYPVEKSNRGYYFLLRYNSKAETVWEVERTLKIADEVLRFVTVRPEDKKPRKPKRPPRTSPPQAADDDGDMEPMPEDF
jgi:small subunit ribosomal protein S6